MSTLFILASQLSFEQDVLSCDFVSITVVGRGGLVVRVSAIVSALMDFTVQFP